MTAMEAMEAYHQKRLREALRAMLNDRPPVSEGEAEEARAYARGHDPRFRVTDEAIDFLRRTLAALDHYRALALALAQDDHAGGLTEAYRAGVAAGIAEGKRRCKEAIAGTVWGGGTRSVGASVLDEVSAEP